MKRTVIIFGILAVLILVIIYAVITGHQFHLVRTDPANGSQNVPTTQIVSFYFNQNLAKANSTSTDSQNYSTGFDFNIVAISPETPGSVSISGKKVVFKPGIQGLTSQPYTMHLTHIKSEQGKTLPDITLSFNVTYVPFNELPADQQQQQINQTDQTQDVNSARNKFIKSLPYTNDNYSIEYIESDDYFLVRVTNSPVATQKAAALKYMTDHGIDTQKERIDYFVIRGLE